MATDEPMSKWRNFASWSAAGGLLVVVVSIIAAVATRSRDGDALAAIVHSGTDPRAVLALLLSMAVVGLSSLNRRFTLRRFRNFLILSAVTAAIAVLAIMSIRALTSAGSFGTMSTSRWTAAGVGLVLLTLGLLLGLILAAARKSWTLLEAEHAETVRERSHLLFLSGISIAAMGLMLILLSLAGPGSILPPAAALAGVVGLAAAETVLTRAVWRAMDELDRTLSYETGNMAFYLTLAFGGGWALLAHLRFMTAAAPLDWLTMLTVVSFVAGMITAGRRKLLSW